MLATYYQPSNKMPLGGVLTTLLGGLLAAVPLALAYVYLTWYVPLVYFNVCFTAILGGAVGAVVHRLARRGHLRSRGGVAWLALLVGLATVYLQWAMYLTLVMNATGSGSDTSTSFEAGTCGALLLNPAAMGKMMRLLSADGTWSVLGVQPSGTFLWLIWLAEAAAIVLIALTYGADRVAGPYSEAARAWASEEKLPQLLAPQPDLAATRAALEAGRFEQVLQPAASHDATPGELWQLRLHRVPGDDSCHYLSLDKLTRKLDKKGQPETSTDPLIQHLAISPARYAALAARFGAAQPEVASR